jgi:peptidoglycan glycosyltransferase
MAMLVLVGMLLVNATYVQVIKGNDYRTDPRNLRVLYNEYSRARGQITTADGTIIAGIQTTSDRLKYLRTYPLSNMYEPVAGYYSLQYGATGIEKVENDVLNGSDDRLFANQLSNLLTGRDPSGGNVQLTLQSQVQAAAYNAMMAKGYAGSVVAMNPQTGAILAMVSTPSYDPNPLASHTTATEKQAMSSNLKASPTVLSNRAISQINAPGSTFKLVVASSALSNGYTPTSATITDPRITLPGTTTTLENYDGETCPGSNLTDALAHSCNTAFAKVAGDLGKDKISSMAAAYGIGQTDLNIPLPVATSTIGSIPDAAALYQTGIGQRDVSITTLQDCMIVSAIANGGKLMQPQLVNQLTSNSSSVVSSLTPTQKSQPITSDVASELTQMMVKSESFTSGDGKNSAVSIASKTGTAEHGTDPKNTPPNAWYVAFAPSANPTIAVAVMVENGGDRGLEATGGKVAASIGRATIDAALGIK